MSDTSRRDFVAAAVTVAAAAGAQAARGASPAAIEPALSNPPGMSKPPTYSHVVEVNGPHRTVYLAGQTGADATGKVAEGFRAQAVQVMENIKTALASVGGGFEHVVKLNSYLTNLEATPPCSARCAPPISRTGRRCRPHAAAGLAARQPGLSGGGGGDRGTAAEGVKKGARSVCRDGCTKRALSSRGPDLTGDGFRKLNRSCATSLSRSR